MNRFSRRRLFGALSAVSLLALARCAATGTGTILTPAQITQANTLLAGAQAAYGIVKTDYPSSVTSIDTAVQQGFTAAQTLLANLSPATSALTAGTSLSAIINDILAVLNLVAPILPIAGVPQDIIDGFQAVTLIASVLSPVAQSLATGGAVPTAAAAGWRVPVIFLPPATLTIDQATAKVATLAAMRK